jgi:hypothetical protein
VISHAVIFGLDVNRSPKLPSCAITLGEIRFAIPPYG